MSAKLSWWDRFLVGLAPRWGLGRVHAKAKLRSYEAAGGGRRTTGWHSPSTDANSAGAPSIAKLRELARDARRNNGWARRGIQVISANTVGRGINARAHAQSTDLAAEAQALWKEWAESVSCDYDGRMPFTGLQYLAMDAIVESGEVLILREAANSSDGLPSTIPLRIRVLEPDYLDVFKQGSTKDGGQIVQGIELDGKGRRVAYWIYNQHPGATGGFGLMTARGLSSRRVPASDVIHVYLVERPGQMRGVSWLAAAIAKLNDFDDYDDALLMQAKIASCFGALVTDPTGESRRLGDDDDDDDDLEGFEPGQIQYLKPHQEVSFAQPPSKSDHGGFSETQLRRIAASLGVTYEDLTMDYSKVNFSSARMARMSHWQNIHHWRRNMLIPQLCNGVFRWAMEMASSMNNWPEVPKAKWSAAPMPMISPEKEGLAIQRNIRTGIKTLFGAIQEQGEDPDTHLAEYAEGNAMLDSLGIVLDSDARKVSAAGMSQPDDEEF